jgi:NhaP-type Na+/H+ or K+/H+ antiporter
VLAYALLSLTVIRMVPVALSLVGSGLDRPSVVFVGWFGPRGLASVVFALLAVEELGESSAEVGRAIAVVTITVLSSVVLHGVTAGPGGRRYVELERAQPTQGAAIRSRRSNLTRTRSGRTNVDTSQQ